MFYILSNEGFSCVSLFLNFNDFSKNIAVEFVD